MRVTDPRTGLAGRCQFLPTVFEVRQACEREMLPIREAQRHDAERQRTRQILDTRHRNRVPHESWRRLRQDLTSADLKAQPE